jgi:hypothetical protein
MESAKIRISAVKGNELRNKSSNNTDRASSKLTQLTSWICSLHNSTLNMIECFMNVSFWKLSALINTYAAVCKICIWVPPTNLHQKSSKMNSSTKWSSKHTHSLSETQSFSKRNTQCTLLYKRMAEALSIWIEAQYVEITTQYMTWCRSHRTKGSKA